MQPRILYRNELELNGINNDDHSLTRNPGERLPASYVNFYISNGGIIAPMFDDPTHDEAAKKLLQIIFPSYEIEMLPGREILLGGGNIHCITQQKPKL